MKKVLFLFFLWVSNLVFSQNTKNYLHIIDSISQKRVDSVAIDLDSLANPHLEKIGRNFKDTIVLKNTVARDFPEEIPVTPYGLLEHKFRERWFLVGQNDLIFNESAFSNWNSGGNNSIGADAKLNYNLSYKKNKHYFENIFLFGYGIVTSKGQASRKTDDYINITSNYGYDLKKNFYLSAGFQFATQFSPGYNYSSTPDPVFSDRISKFMAPGYLNAGLGISYNPNENFQVIFRPANAKFTFVTDPLLQKAGKYGLERDGQSFRSETGAMLNMLYRIKIYKDMNFVSQLNFFSNYIYHPERVDVSYNGVLTMKFNKFISTIVSINLLYDHDQIQKLQMKQTLGIGFTHNFGLENPLKASSKKAIKPFIAN